MVREHNPHRGSKAGGSNTAAILLQLAALLCALISAPSTAGDRVDFNIAAQSADRALIAFARQAELSVLFPTERIGRFTTHAVQGAYGVEEALGLLLQDVGVTGELSGGVLVVRVIQDKGASVEHTNRRSWFSALISSVAAALTAGHASAQTADAPSETPKLDEIVVTAERRETDLQSTPISIVAYTQESLETRGIKTIQDLSLFTPGLSIGGEAEAGGTKPVFMIRGIGQPGGRESQERGVGLYVDDIYIPRTTGSLLQLLDVERVEVLRGPQGTLFGRNTTGGAIRYITRKPTDQFAGEISTAVGSYNRRDVTGLVNVPLGDVLSARFQVGSFQRDGHVKVLAQGKTLGSIDDVVVRGALRFKPSDDLTIDASVIDSKSQQLGPAAVVTALVPGTFQYQALNARLGKLGQPGLVADDPRFVLSDRYAVNGTCYLGVNSYGLANANGTNIQNDQTSYCDYGETQRNTITSLDINWTLTDDWALRSLSAYVAGRSDSINSWGRIYTDRTKDIDTYHSYSQEFQLKYSGHGLDAVGGLYYFQETPKAVNYNRNLAFAGPASFSGDCCTGWNRIRDMKTNSYGAFGQVSWNITQKLSTTLGGRYSYDKKSIAVTRTDSPAVAPGRLLTGSKHWGDLDYRLTLQYGFTDALMAYATHASGYKSGGWNDSPAMTAGLNGGITPYDAEHVKSYEVGLKSQWLDDSLRANLTGFYMDYKDLQIGTPLIDTSTLPTTVVTTVQNAGRVRLSGIEAELLYQPIRHLTLNASVSTLHLDYVSLADGNALLQNCVNPAAPTFDTCQKQDLGRAPKLQYTLGAQYEIGVGSEASLTLDANYGFVDEQQSSSSTANSVLLPSYGLLNLRAQFSPASAMWSLALVATNVTDKYYYTAGGNLSGFYGTKWAAPGRPREIGVEAKVKF